MTTELENLLEAYSLGPTTLRAAVAGMTDDQLRARPVAGTWSTLELVCHLADYEPILADRIKRVLAFDNPTLLGADQDRFAAVLAYQKRDLEEELAVIEATRHQMTRILRAQHGDVLDRTGTHSERGPLTLRQILALAIKHIVHHTAFIGAKREALNIPL